MSLRWVTKELPIRNSTMAVSNSFRATLQLEQVWLLDDLGPVVCDHFGVDQNPSKSNVLSS